MKILVASASKHGSTAEIAGAIGERLSMDGHDVDVRPAEAVEGVAGYDAIVLGSGVYAGHWLDAAKKLIERDGAVLAARQVWLFSSGPIGDPAKPDGEPSEVADLVARTGAVGHRVFAGKIDRHELGFAERAILAVVKAPEGDFRPWDAVHGWAVEIGGVLRSGPVAVAVTSQRDRS
jgi:menaquinone-dependent protoporphyrinogen oxidase